MARNKSSLNECLFVPSSSSSSLILAFSSSQAEPRRRPYPLNQRDNCQSHLFLMALNNLFMAFPLLAEPFPFYLLIPNSDSYDAPAEANMRPWIRSKTTLMILTLVAPMLISRPGRQPRRNSGEGAF